MVPLIVLTSLSITVLVACWVIATYRSVPIAALRSSFRFRPPLADYEIEVGLGLPSGDLRAYPPYLLILLVFHEDDLLFSHSGFNWREIRARVFAFLRGSKLKGGSSITQQVAKNVLNAGAIYGTWRVVLRKLREAILALRLERSLTKREILTLYLQCCRLGPKNLHGFSVAAEHYFGKNVSLLDVPEMCFLVSLVASPTRTIKALKTGRRGVFPYRNLFGRQRDVIRFIVQGWGWGTLAEPGRLELTGVTARLAEHRRFEGNLGNNFETALEIRALGTVASVRDLVKGFVEENREAA